MARPKLLTEPQLDRITEATRQAELKTSGEIVTVVASRAGAYTGYVLLAAAALMFLLSVVYLTLLGPIGRFLRGYFWEFTTGQALWVLVIGQAAVFFLAYVLLTAIRPLKRLVIPKKDRLDKVRRKAESDFFRHHIASTKGGTGVLIYVALFERRVELLVDGAIAAQVPAESWQTVVDGIVVGICRKRFVEDLCQEILRVGEILSPKFPRRADDVNELPDRPVEE
jgi:putative membrane protein